MNRLDKLVRQVKTTFRLDLPPCYGIIDNGGKSAILSMDNRTWNKGVTPEQANAYNQDKITLCQMLNGNNDVLILSGSDELGRA